MRRPLVLAVIFAAFTVGGCRYEFSWVQKHKTLPPEQKDNCFFEIRDELPGEGYVLLAEFTAQRHQNDAPETEHGLRESIEAQVCKLGGKVVVTHPNPTGRYTRGKVYAHVDDG